MTAPPMPEPATATADAPPPPPPPPAATRGRAALVVAATVGLAALVVLHVHDVNGPWYWRWNWRRLPVVPLFPLALACAVPFAVAQRLFDGGRRARRPVAAALLLLMASNLGLQLAFAGAESQPFSLWRVVERVENPYLCSYYTAAAQVELSHLPVTRLLARYPTMLGHFFEHARLKPPGQTLYFLAFVRLLGLGHAAALVPGLLLGVIATASIPATYGMALWLTGDRGAAFAAASYLALCPSLVLFFPTFDQWYPILTCGLVVTWAAALKPGGAAFAAAAAFGAILAVGLFLSWAILFVGIFLAGYAVLELIRRESRWATLARIASRSLLALATAAALYGLAYLLTGYDVVATFRACRALQHQMEILLHRPPLAHVPFDLLDFALGLGWIAVILGPLVLTRQARAALPARSAALTLLVLVQVVAVALTNFIPAETARVWLPLVPLALLPAGLELSRWGARQRNAAYGCLFLLLGLIGRNMTFYDAPHAVIPFPLPPDERGRPAAAKLYQPFAESKHFEVKP